MTYPLKGSPASTLGVQLGVRRLIGRLAIELAVFPSISREKACISGSVTEGSTLTSEAKEAWCGWLQQHAASALSRSPLIGAGCKPR